MKHPVAVAFGIALVVTIVGTLAIAANLRAEETPWALALLWALSPVVWFFAWLVTNGIAWWEGLKGEAGEEQQPTSRR